MHYFEHGVPGAFMSIVGYDLINRAINENGIIKPSDILEFLNDQIRISLRKEEEDLVLKDGMDISFCCLDINTLELEYSGALCPLVYVRQGKIYEIKPDSCSIGISIKKLNRRFTNHGAAGILSAPFIHSSYSHLISNCVPFFVLLTGVFYFYKDLGLFVLSSCWLVGGALTWFYGRGAYHE